MEICELNGKFNFGCLKGPSGKHRKNRGNWKQAANECQGVARAGMGLREELSHGQRIQRERRTREEPEMASR